MRILHVQEQGAGGGGDVMGKREGLKENPSLPQSGACASSSASLRFSYCHRLS